MRLLLPECGRQRVGTIGFLAAFVAGAAAAGQSGRVLIHEIAAAGASAPADEDGETPDWIEIHNPGPGDVDLEGWSLTDDAAALARWRFPAVALPAGAYLLVFASGKDRAAAGRELHTNFRLDAGGEYLALVRPDGVTVEDSLAPAYPPQRDGYAFGTAFEPDAEPLVPLGAPARVLVPADDSPGRRWTGGEEPFDDSAWLAGPTGAGYEHSSDGVRPLVALDFNDASDPLRAADVSGHENHGAIASHLEVAGWGGGSVPAYTAAGGGRTGLAGDRSLDFGPGGNGGLVAVGAAAAGAFDAAVQADAVTVSLWLFGSAEQPADDVIFWGSSNPDGTGIRSLNAHVPWSDSTIYWDTAGCCDGTQRIQKPEPNASFWRGRWNHYVFVKEGPRKEIWQNGALFHEGVNVAPLTPIRGLFVGCALRSGEWSYGGRIDDFALWDRALAPGQIAALAAGASPVALSTFAHLVGTDLSAAMAEGATSAYVRIPFSFDPSAAPEALILRMRFDAGFIAYLNGVEVARRSAPAAPRFDSRATAARGEGEVIVRQDFDVTGGLHLLRPGRNVLALHGLSAAPGSPGFLVAPELVGARAPRGRYLRPPTPGAANSAGVAGFTAEARFSVEHGFFSAPFTVELACDTPGAVIHYATGGVVPGPGLPGSRLYTGPVTVSRTTILRAAAVKVGLEPAAVVTRTYVFPAEVARQPALPAGLPASWSGAAADYEVDPEVTGTALPGHGTQEALLSIPSISIVMDPQDLFSAAGGIYYYSTARLERAGSIELIEPGAGGDRGFQVNAGIRIHGYTSRDPNFTLKHSFRVVFKSDFGPSKLAAALFPDADVERFDQIVLRGMSTDSWPVMDGWPSPIPGVPRWFREKSTYLREQWMKDAQLAMGQLSSHAFFVHVYLNGLYWGLYQLTERPTESFLAEHLGGVKEEYDVLHDFAELHGGDLQAWNEMMTLAAAGLSSTAAYQRLQGNNPDGTRNPAFPRYLDLDNLIDYMILHIFAGADDWPNHNWWAGRRRGAESLGFQFFVWDQEITNISLVQTQTSWGTRFEEVSAANTPAYLYSQLRSNLDFRRRFGDRVHKHLFGSGALSPAACQARWSARQEEVDRAIVGESARWGDARRSLPYRREAEWLAEMDWMREEYWPASRGLALERFRRVGLYPALEAPTLSHDGGRIEAGLDVAVAAAAGTVYVTLDDIDPRAPSGVPAPTAFTPAGSVRIDATATLKARARNGGVWSALAEAYYFIDVPLRITEVMYHPADPPAPGPHGDDDFEFIELENVGTEAVSLRGIFLFGAVRFDFARGSITTLAPGEIVVLPRDAAAFAARYGSAGIRIAGVYDGELRNGGERLLLLGPDGEPLQDFRYLDGWYPETDGGGPSLVVADPGGDPALWGRREGWRPSRHLLGSPGRRESAAAGGLVVGGDSNGDGELDIGDPVLLLFHLFPGGGGPPPLPCGVDLTAGANRVLLDANGDGRVDLTDGVFILTYLFGAGPAPSLGAGCVEVEGCPDACR